MHNTYYFLRQFSAALALNIRAWHISACFTQAKDELVLGFTNCAEELFLKATLTARFSALHTAPAFQRARRNTLTLFPEILGATVTGLVQHRNERSFYLTLSNGLQLLFKQFGNRANVVLFQDGLPVRIFNNQLKNDWNLRLEDMDRELDFSLEHYLSSDLPARQLYPTLGELAFRYLDEQGFQNLNRTGQWQLIEQVRQTLENPTGYLLIDLNSKLHLSLLPLGQVLERYDNPLEAQNQFVRQFLGRQGFQELYQTWHDRLSKAQKQAAQFIQKNQTQLTLLEAGKSYAQLADVLMANLHQIPPRTTEIELDNFYTGQKQKFTLKPDETPQKTAERYYRKAKQQPRQLARLKESIAVKEMQYLQLQEQLDELNQIPDYKTLKQFAQKLEAALPAVAKPENTLPFKAYQYQGFAIWVGRSARNNDLLTQKFAHKDDLWLHAKDVSVSHVVIRQQAGKPFPEPVLEVAAQLAAWHTKRKTDSLCPVTYTPKKFVRKPKGAADGAVFVEKEKVLLVPPADYPEFQIN